MASSGGWRTAARASVSGLPVSRRSCRRRTSSTSGAVGTRRRAPRPSGATWLRRQPRPGRYARARAAAGGGCRAGGAAATGPVRGGGVGGGTGARGGGLKGGVGTASVYLGDGVYVGAMVIVNPAGSPVDRTDCTLYGVKYGV